MNELVFAVLFVVIGSSLLTLLETAIVSVNVVKVRLLTEERKSLKVLEDQPDNVGMAYFMLAMMFDVIGINWCAMMANDLFEGEYIYYYTAIVTVVLLYSATLLPKMLGTKYSEVILLKLGGLVVFLFWVTRPLSLLIASPMRLLFNGSGKRSLTVSELSSTIRAAKSLGVIDKAEQQLVNNILTKMEVKDLMRCASEIDSVDIEDTIADVEDIVHQGKHKRYVVTQRKKSTIEAVGVVLYRDLVSHWLKGEKDLEVKAIMHEVCTVKTTDSATSLLKSLKENEDHLAVVLGSSGIMLGVLSSDDIIEHLFVPH